MKIDTKPTLLIHFDDAIYGGTDDVVSGLSIYGTNPSTSPLVDTGDSNFKKCIKFDGTFGIQGTGAYLDPTKDFTISLSTYMDDNTNGGCMAMFQAQQGCSSGIYFGIMSGGNVCVYIYDTNGTVVMNNEAISDIASCKNVRVNWELDWVDATKMLYIFKNGKTVKSLNIPNRIGVGSNNLSLGYSTYWGYCKVKMDEFMMLNGKALHTAEFTPPTDPFAVLKRLFLAKLASKYYSYKTGTWVDVGTPAGQADLATLFQNQGTSTCPTQAQLELLGTGSNRPKRCCWQDDSSVAVPVVALSAVPKTKIIKPTTLLPIKSIDSLDSISISYTLSGSAATSIKVAVTLNGTDYFIFNSTSGAWESINIDTQYANMMPIAQVTALTKAQLALLTANALNIGFAYCVNIEDVTDVAKIDKTALVVDMKGSWDSATKGTDYKYGYPANDILKVTLLTAGNYKINYSA